jgi:hypothetical protein
MNREITKRVEAILDETGLEWTIENGKKHKKIFLGGRFIGCLSQGSKVPGFRSVDNIISNIRRAVRQHGQAV